MEFEQALEVVSLALNREIARPLTEVEVALVFGAWNKLTYNDLAARSGYSTNYLQRDIGPKFWKLLSDRLGRQVNKTNLRSILSQIPPPIADLPIPKPSATDWGEAIDVSSFQGRVAEIEKLTHWIIEDRCRLIALVGMGDGQKCFSDESGSTLTRTISICVMAIAPSPSLLRNIIV